MAGVLSLDLDLSSKLRYGLGGINHIIGDSSLVNQDVYIYATGFSDGEYVTVSMEADSGTTVYVFQDDGFHTGGVLNFDSTKRMRITVQNLEGKKMLILARNGSMRKVKDYAPELTMDEIDHAWLDNYFSHLRKLGNNDNTAFKNMTNLKKYVLYAWREGYIDNNPFRDWHIKKTTASCVYLTEDELNVLIELYTAGELEYKLHKSLEFFLFLCFSSLHVGDALTLKLEQFQDKSFTYYRLKLRNSKPQPIVVPISDPLRHLLDHIVGTRKKGPIFEAPYTEQAMNRLLKEIATIADIDKKLTLKVGRHTFATIYLRKTKDLSSLKEILGHSSLHETMVYAHVMDESKQEGIQCFNSFTL